MIFMLSETLKHQKHLNFHQDRFILGRFYGGLQSSVNIVCRVSTNLLYVEPGQEAYTEIDERSRVLGLQLNVQDCIAELYCSTPNKRKTRQNNQNARKNARITVARMWNV